MKRILILSANPKDTDKLRLDEEIREIQAGLERSKRRDQFEIITRSALRVDDLRRALLDNDPQIIHFSGHGAREYGLALENATGEMQLVSTEALANLFGLAQNTIECVLLNACYSETQAEAIYQHINCVIGMNQAIGDRAAIKFAIGFYDALGAGKSYEQAYDYGCNAIALAGLSESTKPVIRCRPGRLSSEAKSAASANSTQERLPDSPNDRSESPTSKKSAVSITMTAGDNAKQIGHIEKIDNFTM